MTTMTLGKALNAGLRDAMEDDPKVLIMGEDVGKLGGVFRVTDGLQKDFGEDRVIDTPLAESGIVGTAVGLAFRGYRPVVRDPVRRLRLSRRTTRSSARSPRCTSAARGTVKMPIVIRIPFGGGIGAVEHHSESPEAYFAHTAGLKVVSCSNPHDAYRMIQQAIASDDPVVFFEPKRRYWEKGEVDLDAEPGAAAGVADRARRARTRRSSPTARWSRPAWTRPRAAGRGRPRPRGHRPAYAVAARPGPCSSRYARTGRASSCTRRRAPSASAPRSPRGSPRSASTRSRRRCCGSPATTCPIRRAASRRIPARPRPHPRRRRPRSAF